MASLYRYNLRQTVYTGFLGAISGFLSGALGFSFHSEGLIVIPGICFGVIVIPYVARCLEINNYALTASSLSIVGNMLAHLIVFSAFYLSPTTDHRWVTIVSALTGGAAGGVLLFLAVIIGAHGAKHSPSKPDAWYMVDEEFKRRKLFFGVALVAMAAILGVVTIVISFLWENVWSFAMGYSVWQAGVGCVLVANLRLPRSCYLSSAARDHILDL